MVSKVPWDDIRNDESLLQQSENWVPHAYQKKAVKFLLEHGGGALFLDPGLGKTAIALAALKILKKQGLCSKTLLIAPLRVCYNVWPAEIKKWLDFNYFKISIIHGPKKEEALKAEADIYIVNPEGLDWLLQIEKSKGLSGRTKVALDVRRWKNFGFDTLIVDELSKFKHVNTIRFKALKQVLGTFSRRWGLTGSPAPNGLLDLFGQCFILDQGNALGPYITYYRMKYFVQSYNGFEWTLREGADQEIYTRLKPLALRMAAEDYLEMPELVENNIRVLLPDEAMRIYNDLERDLLTQIKERTVVASNAAVASGKCRQVANGGLYYEPSMDGLFKKKEKREWIDLHEAKLDAVEELVEELQGSPLLVAYDFKHDLARLQKRFKGAPFIGGGLSEREVGKLIAGWNAGKIPVLFGHPQSVAHGLNLQGSGYHICWHSLPWDYELYDQFIRRLRRQGSKAKQIFSHHIIAAKTIDEAVLVALKSKRRGQDALFTALRNYKK